MPAPTTSPRPTVRPDIPAGWTPGDSTGPGITLDRPLTDEELIGLGVDPSAFAELPRDQLAEILEASNRVDFQTVGRALSGVGTIADAIAALAEVEEIFDLQWNDDHPGVLGLAEITIDYRELNETLVSTSLTVVSFGVTDLITRNGESLGDSFANEFFDLQQSFVGQINSSGEQYLQNIIDGYLNSSNRQQPVLLDLDHDGLEFTAGAASIFDVDGDGYLENTAWSSPDDGFLVIDLNSDGTRGSGDGQIDQARELAFSLWTTGATTDLQALAEARDSNNQRIFDSNGDGVLNASDTIWNELKVWRDVNLDGKTDAGELLALSDWDITSINLGYDNGLGYHNTSDDYSIFGNTVFGTASFTMGGQVYQGGVGDIALAYNADGQRVINTATGFDIEFETGDVWSYLEMSGGAQNVNLTTAGLRGVIADARNNYLNAATVDGGVVVAAGAGNDTVIGSSHNDVLSGEGGNDLLRGGLGDDVYLFGLGDGVLTIDESLFEVNANGTTSQSSDSSLFSSEYVPPSGAKDGFGHTKWVHDTQSGVTVQSLAGGRDTLVLGDGIGVADLVFSEGTHEDIGLYTHLDYDMTIEFLDETEVVRANTKVVVKNWGEKYFQLEELKFTHGQAIDLETHVFDIFGAHLVNGVTGTQGVDSIQGRTSGSWISTLGGNDAVVGGIHVDVINGGSGNDTLTGGQFKGVGPSSQDDYFLFNENDGNDVITDFEVEHDKIVFDIVGMSFVDLAIVSTTAGAVITYDADDTITLTNVAASALTETSFDFA